MTMANTLAYYDTATITAIESFIALAPQERKKVFDLVVIWDPIAIENWTGMDKKDAQWSESRKNNKSLEREIKQLI